MSTRTQSTPSNPHGGTLINRLSNANPNEFAHLPKLEINDRNFADLELIATGVYSPLTGFQGLEDWQNVVKNMRLANGIPWSIPITLGVSQEIANTLEGEIALVFHGEIVGTLEINEKFVSDKALEAQEVYRTTDEKHPGVQALYAQGEVNLAGPIKLFKLSRGEFPTHHYTPLETRQQFEARGWKTVVAFQTRNPIHRAHEHLHKVALELPEKSTRSRLGFSARTSDTLTLMTRPSSRRSSAKHSGMPCMKRCI